MTNDDLLLTSGKKKGGYLPLFAKKSSAVWNTDFPEVFVYTEKEVYGIPGKGFSEILTDNNKKYKITFEITSASVKAFYYAFDDCTNLTSVSFPELTSIDSKAFYYAFYGCTNLTSVSFPKASSIDSEAFYYAFYGCTNLTSVSFPKLTSASNSAFYSIGHSNLTIHLPKSLSNAGLDTQGSFYGKIVYDL